MLPSGHKLEEYSLTVSRITGLIVPGRIKDIRQKKICRDDKRPKEAAGIAR